MGHIEGTSRAQHILFPAALDDSMAEEHPVRFIDAFVDSLDLHALGFRRTQPAVTGRPSYAPGDVLKLYIYGDMNRRRSSRRREKDTHRNIELRWLLRTLPPDFKTIADFRKDNAKAFQQVFRAFTLLCKEWGWFGAAWVAIDGSKFQAVNNKQRNFTQAKLRDLLPAGDAKLEQYLRALEAADAAETEVPPPTAAALREKIQHLRARKGRYEQLQAALEASGESQVSLTAPDSRARPKSPKVDVGSNVPTAVDAKPKLLLEQHGTNAVTDVAPLSVMAIAAKEMLGVEPLQGVAEMGDYHGEEIKAWEEAGSEPYGAKPLTSAKRKLGLYGKEPFPYEPESDCYRCPAGQALTCRFATVELGRQRRYYATTAWRTCALQARCTRNKEGRRITRWVHEHLLEKMQKRVEATPALMQKRKQIVEHPFGPIKDWHDHAYFLLKGLEQVRAEVSLSTLAYNLRRVMTILGVAPMLRALPGGEKRPVPYRMAVSCWTSTPTRQLAWEE
jgi:transposase